MENAETQPKADDAPLKLKLLALLCALAILAAMIVAIYSVQSAREVVTGIAAAFRPNEKFGTVLSGTIGQLNNNPKLIVLTADVKATVIQENTTTFASIPVGSAKVEVSAPAKIQFYVAVNMLSSRDFTYDEVTKKLVVKVPSPVLDTDVVGMESDPDKISVRTETGISPLSIFKIPKTRDDAMRHLKEAALVQGKHELLIEKAQKNAKKAVADQLDPVVKLLNDGVTLEVEFKK